MISSHRMVSPALARIDRIAVIVGWAPGVTAMRSSFGTMPRIDSQDEAATLSFSLPVVDW